MGAAVAFVFSRAPRGKNQALVQVAGCAAIVLVLAGLALYRAQQIQTLIPVG